MKTIVINDFSGGMADDRFSGRSNQYSFAKHFDTLTWPKRLQPLRGMVADTANTGIGNIQVFSDGLMYGLGVDYPGNPTLGKLWQRAGYGASDGWQSVPTNSQLSGVAAVNEMLVENPDAGQARQVYWSSTNLLVASDKSGATSASTDALTFVTIGQGHLHSKDKTIYFPYRTSSASYIGLIAPSGSAFGGKNYTAFTLPFLYRAYCLSEYNDYLAIPLTNTGGIGVNSSLVALWRRDTSVTTFDETIPWGIGNLQVLNNLNGVLVGISTLSANIASSTQDFNAVQIKVWAGGAEPTLVKTIKAQHLAGSSSPSCTINPRVNFIYNNRLYFSINVVPGDGKQASWYGLWSVGKNELGEWTTTLERVETNANTGTGVIAAAIQGDFVDMVYTSEGTIACTINGVTANTTYAATSVYESLVNPGMPSAEKMLKKKLFAARVDFAPLPASAQIVLKYRIDSDGDTADWVTLKTFSTTDAMHFDVPNIYSYGRSDFFNVEFRIESTGGAVVNSFSYKYQPLAQNIV